MMSDRSLILATSVGALFHTAMLFSVFLLFSGHNAPGGGFVGGLVAGAAVVLRYIDGGTDAVRSAIRLQPTTVLGAGLTTAVLTAVTPLLVGGSVLESATFKAVLPVIGTIKTTSALVFDIGVYFVVVGLVLMIIHALGGEEDQ